MYRLKPSVPRRLKYQTVIIFHFDGSGHLLVFFRFFHSIDESRKNKTQKNANKYFFKNTNPNLFWTYKTKPYDRGSLWCPRFGRAPLGRSLNSTLQKLNQQYTHDTYNFFCKSESNVNNFVLCIKDPIKRGFPKFQCYLMSGRSPFSTSYRFFLKIFFFLPRDFSPCAPNTILQYPIQWCCRSFNSIAQQLKILERIKFLALWRNTLFLVVVVVVVVVCSCTLQKNISKIHCPSDVLR